MAPADNDHRALLRDSAATLLGRVMGPGHARRLRDAGSDLDPGVWREMAAAGWFRMTVPDALGGLDFGLGEIAVLAEQLGRHVTLEPVLPAILLAGGIIAGGDNLNLRERLIARMAEGKLVPALAWQERPGLLDPADAMPTTQASGGPLRLSGTKRFVPCLRAADGFVVSTACSDGLALYWVARDAPGVSTRIERLVDGGSVGDVCFDVAVGASDRLASPAIAHDLLARNLESTRVAVSAELLGVAARAFEMMLDYVKQREQFGRPIGSFQAVQHRLADLHVQQEIARAAVKEAVTTMDGDAGPVDRAIAASSAKARAGDVALLVTRQAIQFYGAMGYTDECDIGLYLKRALVLAAYLGNSIAHRRRYAALAPEVA